MTSNPPPTSATVLDFICLFTHDLKRKQKRWQDGVLKYHTFNKRIMVYDDHSHFIGDAHWQEGGDLQPGDEFELDRGSAIVQVADCTGQREQDLTELLDKRAKDVERRRANAVTRTPGQTAGQAQTPRNDQSAHFQLRHRPLTDLVGGSSRIGRAVISPHSPYEARKMAAGPDQPQESPSEDARPSKRRKREVSPPSKMGHARSLFGATLSLTPFSSSNPAVRSQALRDRTNVIPNTTSDSARTAQLGLPVCVDSSPRSPSPSENPEKEDTSHVSRHTVPRKTVPRQTFPQRASLRELIAGNEHNASDHRPRAKEGSRHSHRGVGQPVESHPMPPKNEVVTRLVHKPLHPRANERIRPKDTEQPPSPPRTVLVDLTESAPSADSETLLDDNDQAFMDWLRPSESNPTSRKVPDQPAKSHLALTRDTSPNTASVRRPAQGDDDQEAEHVPKKARTRNDRTKPGPSTKDKTNIAIEASSAKRALNAKKSAATPETDCLPQVANGPRTELRIRSRQRRGLLMISEKRDRGRTTQDQIRDTPDTASEAQSTPEPEPPSVSIPEESHVAHSRVLHRNLSGDTAKRQRSASSRASSVNNAASDDSSSDDSEATVEKPTMEKGSDSLYQPEAAQIEDAPSPSSLAEQDIPTKRPRLRANPARRSRPKPARPFLSDDEEEQMATDSPSEHQDAQEVILEDTDTDPKSDPKPSLGPRITKMGRKSVKSREIIGFVMPPNDLPAVAFTTMSFGHRGQAEAEKKSDDNVTPKSHTDGAQVSSNQSTRTNSLAQPEGQHGASDKPEGKQPPRLINPASRGRKAARREDAAGLQPQTIVQFDPAIAPRIVPAKPAPSGSSGAQGSNGAQSALPGFMRADGGAWSRHAEDLLGMTRPSRKTPRR
ncbi:hypothetical protein FZEAL_8385 [Fusarium zealandicum]|uniref:5'-3' DNA helicase ZGRF1-like N-terminal domain-containing protein n=1 Tax=Fusarium zealandicum TaxID=1053134 RepID=A0A8H4XHJ9_9HYPO|nr:hypothetical protein FZEAL_8385 [Fusarium zealandicum]